MTENQNQNVTNQWSNARSDLLSGQTDEQIINNNMSKQDKKINSLNEKLQGLLTDDETINSIITTPQSQWNPYQIATANLNPDLKSRNKKYQSTLDNMNILENEKVNLAQAGEIMLNAYKDAINSTNDAAYNMMAANNWNALLQAAGAISGNAGLATNPAAAAQTRLSALNQAALQNMQVRSNADQNIASIYNSIAGIPWQISSMAGNNAQIDYTNAQADYARRQWNSSGSSSSGSSSNGYKYYNQNGGNGTYQWWQETPNGSYSNYKWSFADNFRIIDKWWVQYIIDKNTGKTVDSSKLNDLVERYPEITKPGYFDNNTDVSYDVDQNSLTPDNMEILRMQWII